MVDYKINLSDDYKAALVDSLKECFPFGKYDETIDWQDLAKSEVFWAVFLTYDGKKTLTLAADEYVRDMRWDEKLMERVAFAKGTFDEKQPRLMVDEEALAPLYYGEFCMTLLHGDFIAEYEWELIGLFVEGAYKELASFLKKYAF